jgi:hypothetical protein
MSHRNIFDLNGAPFTEIQKLMRVEIGSQICDNGVGKAKAVYDVADESNHSICSDRCNWPVLYPLSKLVDGNQHVRETSWRSCERPYHV